MRIAGIDQGTTSTRSLILGDDGLLEMACSREHRQIYPREGWVEHDPEELIANIRACVEACGNVDAVGLANQGESCLAWNGRTGQALTPIIVWQDSRTIASVDSLRNRGAEAEVLRRAGLPLDPYFSASKLGWILENVPEARHARNCGELRIGTSDAFFLDRLTGCFVTDASTASRTSLMNLEACQWDETLCELFGVPIECLPPIVTTTGEFGVMETASGRIPLTASIVDQQAALYGFGCRLPGHAKITFGTGAFAMMVTGETIHRQEKKGLLPTLAWHKAGNKPVYALDGGVYSASSALNWARSLGLFSEYAEIQNFTEGPAISSGLAFIPALSGLACPYWDRRARGAFVGLSLEHGPLRLVQSVLEGVAMRAGQVMNALEACKTLKGALPIDGGLSRNPYFVQFLANILEREIRPARMPEMTGLGAILLAAEGAGYTRDHVPDFDACTPQTVLTGAMARFERAVDISRQWDSAVRPVE